MPVLTKVFVKVDQSIEEYTLQTSTCTASIINYGATMTKFVIDGKDVLLGFDDPFGQIEVGSRQNPYFGAFVGRACNRTENGNFEIMSVKYQLPVNNGPNSLHGGLKGFDKQFFKATVLSQDPPSVLMSHKSSHLDQGFPGTIFVEISFTLNGSELVIETKSELVGDEVDQTYVNLTMHPYFNLSGCNSESIEDHLVKMNSVLGCLELNENQIPTGKLLKNEDRKELFFLSEKAISKALPLVQEFKGFDHYYLVNDGTDCITVRDPSTKIQLVVSTTAPGFQFYTGNWLDGSILAKKSQGCLNYGPYGGFCIEPSSPPNSINMPEYRDTVLLKRGIPKVQTIKYRLEYN